jgi:tetratricopeptide (TPR) repeat protein
LPVCDPPAAAIVGSEWRERLEASARDWHALYQLGLLRLADGERDGAREAWDQSVAARRTPWALRCLAFLDQSADLLVEAHGLAPDLRELSVEAIEALLAEDRHRAALALIEQLTPDDRAHGRIRLAEARAALGAGDRERVVRLLAQGISVDNLREGEVSLDALWLAVHPGEEVPPRYDFRMAEEA